MPAFKRSQAPSPIDTKPVPAKQAGQAAGSEEQAANVQSPPLSPLLHVREDRDALAIEHDRQKYFKALDRARNKAKKAFGIESKSSAKSGGTGGRTNARVASGRPHHHHGAQERSVAVGDEDKESEFWLPVEDGGAGTPANAANDHLGGRTAAEVRLADLVYAPQVKKTGSHGRKKGSGGLGGDFEFVPHIRSVIVLDDANGRKTRDMDVDDAWECVEDESVVKQKVTYASIAAAAALTGN